MRIIIAAVLLAGMSSLALAADAIKSDCKGSYLYFSPYLPRDVVGDKPKPADGIKLETDLTKKTILLWRDIQGADVPGNRRSDAMEVYRITKIDNAVIEFTLARTKVHFDTNAGTIDRTNGAFHYESKRVDDGSKGMKAGEYTFEENLVCSGFAKVAQQPTASWHRRTKVGTNSAKRRSARDSTGLSPDVTPSGRSLQGRADFVPHVPPSYQAAGRRRKPDGAGEVVRGRPPDDHLDAAEARGGAVAPFSAPPAPASRDRGTSGRWRRGEGRAAPDRTELPTRDQR
jgi:hypothetical protein